MSVQNWEKIKDVFALVLEQPVDRREDFLRRTCGDDFRLRAEVESLLKAHDRPELFIERNDYSIASAIQSTRVSYKGRQFGNYRIVAEIGRGGMGTVFLAERADGEFHQRVALKVVRRSFAEPELVRRFRQERQILATLNHPNIAQLLDGGVSRDGEPFLAMEYVEGVRIDEYCREKNLAVEERLKLFLQVCRAVGFAHQNLVVHRDIKPSNILVTKHGVPKLLDFGIAKLLDAEHAAEQTQTSHRAFTPEYASPEQTSGGQITTASDVYSLGVLLSKLVLNPKENSSEPSLKTNSNTARTKTADRRPKTELEAIIQMARRAEAERRFGTVAQFAEDIERYLNGLPVRAQKDSFTYRAGKFIKRNKLSVSAGVLISLSLIVGFAVALWQADVARRERDRAEKRFADVRELSNALLTDVAPKIERLPGSTEARQALVNQSLKYLDRLARESGGDSALQSELALAYEKIGDLQGNPQKPNLSDFGGAILSYEKARAIRQSLPQSIENQMLLGGNFRELSSVRYVQNDIKGSLGDSAEALKIYETLLAEKPESFELQMSYVETQIDHAQTYSFNNQHDIAIPLFRRALAVLEKLDRTHEKTQLLLAKCYSSLGNALSWDSKQAEAEIEMAKAVSIAAALDARNPYDASVQQAVWRVYILASSIYEDIKNEVSLQFAQKALQTAQKAVESDTADTQAKHNLAKTFSRLGIIFALLNKFHEASFYLNKTENILLELTEREPNNQTYQNDLGRLYTRVGDTGLKQKDLPGALKAFEKSAAFFEKISDDDEKNTFARRDWAQSLKSLAQVHFESAQRATRKNQLNHLLNAKNIYRQAFDIITRLKEQNALSEFDKKLFDELQSGIRKTEQMSDKN